MGAEPESEKSQDLGFSALWRVEEEAPTPEPEEAKDAAPEPKKTEAVVPEPEEAKAAAPEPEQGEAAIVEEPMAKESENDEAYFNAVSSLILYLQETQDTPSLENFIIRAPAESMSD